VAEPWSAGIRVAPDTDFHAASVKVLPTADDSHIQRRLKTHSLKAFVAAAPAAYF
jgi:hypothetical protein